MQQLTKPLRTCRVCGLQAHTEEDLELFVRNKPSVYGYLTLCKRCERAESKERKQRTGELTEAFRTRSPDGIIRCYFCWKEVTKLRGLNGDSLDIHSLDENHENWDHANKVPTHHACHVSYHSTGKKSPNWKGDIASDSAKRKRVRRDP